MKPAISIVTPSFNQARYFEKCLRSIHDQNYEALEHLVYDGGSNDGTLALIEQYEEKIAHWESGPDGGQSAAINKGLTRATGEILCWVNSDDGLTQGTLNLVAERLPLDRPAWLVGQAYSLSSKGRRIKVRAVTEVNTRSFMRYKEFWIPQPSVFWNRAMQEHVGVLSSDLDFVMDLDLFYRMHRVSDPIVISDVLSFYTVHEDAKTTANPEGVDLEYANWLEQRISNDEMDITQILFEFTQLQRVRRTITEHVVISRVVRWWKKYVNPNLHI